MKLQHFALEDLQHAIHLYDQLAFAGADPPVRAPLWTEPSAGRSVADVLDAFHDELQGEEGHARCYVLRLGNARYPYMKLALAEHLIRGEFFLAVDTHDQMFRSGGEEEEIAELQRFNAGLKQAIESSWREAGLPTAAHLKGLLEGILLHPGESRGQRILVADDDRDAGETISLLLRSQGYDVDLVGDGQEAVESADPGRHDLILLDCEMPRLDGMAACRRLKSQPETRGIPILIATAGAIDLRQVDEADAFLTKPFPAEILFNFLEHLLRSSKGEGP